jgi:hypothetical protein
MPKAEKIFHASQLTQVPEKGRRITTTVLVPRYLLSKLWKIVRSS